MQWASNTNMGDLWEIWVRSGRTRVPATCAARGSREIRRQHRGLTYLLTYQVLTYLPVLLEVLEIRRQHRGDGRWQRLEVTQGSHRPAHLRTHGHVVSHARDLILEGAVSNLAHTWVRVWG